MPDFNLCFAIWLSLPREIRNNLLCCRVLLFTIYAFPLHIYISDFNLCEGLTESYTFPIIFHNMMQSTFDKLLLVSNCIQCVKVLYFICTVPKQHSYFILKALQYQLNKIALIITPTFCKEFLYQVQVTSSHCQSVFWQL